MSKKAWIIKLIQDVTHCDKPTAEMLLERLKDEGVLTLGYGSAEVDKIAQKFTDTFGTTKVSQYDRFAAHRLAQKYGAQAVCGVIDLLAKNSNEKYRPVINNVSQLEQKWPSILNFLRNLGGEEIIEV